MKKRLSLVIALACFATQNFATGNPSVAASSNLHNSQKIVAYSKDGVLYRSEMYIGNSNTPSLVNEYVAGGLPKGIKKHVYNSFEEFVQARPTLDSNYAHIMLKAKSTDIKTSNLANEVAYAFDPSVNIFAHVGPNQCYKSDPATGGGSQYTSKMVGLDANASLEATLNIDKDLRLFSASDTTGIELASDHFILNQHYLGKFNYGNYNFIGAVLANLYTGIPSTENVTSNGYGTWQNNTSAFLAQCGSAGINGFLGGLIASANIKIISTNQKFDYDLKNDFNGSIDLLERLTSKLHSKAERNVDISRVVSTFDFKGDIIFNQPIEGSYTFSDYVGMKIAQNSNYARQCEASNPVNLTACATYIENISTAINSGLLRANGSIPNNPGAVSTLVPFPYGVKIPGITPPQVSFGSKNPYISYSQAHSNGQILLSDPFHESIKDNLVKDRDLIFQLRTLAARANFLANSTEFVTTQENVFLTRLANYFNQDANALLKAGKTCYKNTVDSYSIYPSTTCSNTVVLSDKKNIMLSKLPTNVYELYSNYATYANNRDENNNIIKVDKDGKVCDRSTPKNVICTDLENTYNSELGELLFKNSIALQYEANYKEEFSGLSDGNDSKNSLDTIRAANQIQFAGVVFYNSAYNSDEFFAGHNTIAGKDKNYFRGYILAGMDRARLGKGDKEEDNTIGGKPGMKWWQFHKSSYSAVRKSEVFEPSKLYFVLNSELLPIGKKIEQNSQDIIFNKVIDNMSLNNPEKSLTADSSSFSKDDNLVKLTTVSHYPAINTQALLPAGSEKLPSLNYYITSKVTDLNLNREKFGVTCVGGTYLAKMDFPNKSTQAQLYDKATFGSNNPNDYLCYRAYDNNPNDKWTYFKMGQNGNIAYRTKDLEENISLELKPIAPFF